jgi:hypothetical protein
MAAERRVLFIAQHPFWRDQAQIIMNSKDQTSIMRQCEIRYGPRLIEPVAKLPRKEQQDRRQIMPQSGYRRKNPT